NEQRAELQLFAATGRRLLFQPGMRASVFDHRRWILGLLGQSGDGEQRNENYSAHSVIGSQNAGGADAADGLWRSVFAGAPPPERRHPLSILAVEHMPR